MSDFGFYGTVFAVVFETEWIIRMIYLSRLLLQILVNFDFVRK